MSGSFLFYDLETFDADPQRSRIAQFAAIRTDEALAEVEAPIDFLVRPADDLLPSPYATLITGIEPQRALRDGVNEAGAFARIADAMSRPGTCTLGYNSLRFDDEFVRNGFFRNFHDPYEREWRNGNCRWDLLDVMRMAHALRPDGLQWPVREDGFASFRLEHLALANGVREGDAHEALSDVRALIGLARLLRAAQPKFWDYALRLRDKRYAGSLLDPIAMAPVLHVSQRYPAARLCAAAVVPLTRHPRFDGRVIVFDLGADPAELLDLDADAIAARLFVRREELPEGVERIALKEVHLNRSPALVAWNHLRDGDFERLAIDRAGAEARATRLRANGPALAEKIRQVHALERERAPADADASLYDGFLPDADRRRCAQVRATPPQLLGGHDFGFSQPRLDELLFRYRARNWPELLAPAEHERWDAFRRERLAPGSGLASPDLGRFEADLATLRAQHAGEAAKLALLDRLEAWRAQIGLQAPAPGVAG
jgi:exodeoxyribonuclease-1